MKGRATNALRTPICKPKKPAVTLLVVLLILLHQTCGGQFDSVLPCGTVNCIFCALSRARRNQPHFWRSMNMTAQTHAVSPDHNSMRAPMRMSLPDIQQARPAWKGICRIHLRERALSFDSKAETCLLQHHSRTFVQLSAQLFMAALFSGAIQKRGCGQCCPWEQAFQQPVAPSSS